MDSMERIENLTKAFADAHQVLVERVTALTALIEDAKRRHLRGLKTAVSDVAQKRAELMAAIDTNRTLFDKPRTRVFHGVQVGLRKRDDSIEFDDPEQVVKMIEKHLPNKYDVLVKVERKPIKRALKNLPITELKKLGVSILEGQDDIVISPTASDIDKVVDALLDGVEEIVDQDTRAI